MTTPAAVTVPSRPFGAGGPPVPVVGEGSWNMEADGRAACVDAIRRGLDAGSTHVDTAEMYGGGRVEEIVGEAIAGRRDEVFLVTKVLPSNATYAGTLRACDASLKRLRTDRIDVYLLHWPSAHPLAETIRAFETLVAAGKIRGYGVSNFDEAGVEEAVALAGPGKIRCNQVLYHLGERSIEHAVIPACEKHGIAVVAYSPFGSTGRLPGPKTTGGHALAEIAATHDATPHQVALAFLTRRPSLFAIPKSAVAAHVVENAGAARIALTTDQVATIDAVFPVGRRGRGVPTL